MYLGCCEQVVTSIPIMDRPTTTCVTSFFQQPRHACIPKPRFEYIHTICTHTRHAKHHRAAQQQATSSNLPNPAPSPSCPGQHPS